MDRASVLAQLQIILDECLQGSLPDIQPDSVLTADLGLNSMELFDIICTVEERFDIEIPDRMLPKLVTVQDVVEYLEKAA